MSNGTFTIPELRCSRHFYGAALCPQQAQAPVNEGIVIVPPCEECEAAEAAREQAFEAMREALRYAETYFDANNDHEEAARGFLKVRAALVLADKVSR